jgi:hypothetical protein
MLWPDAFTSHIKFQNVVLKEGAEPAAEKSRQEQHKLFTYKL